MVWGNPVVEAIQIEKVQAAFQPFVGHRVYLHLETTPGAYAAESWDGSKGLAAGAYIRNAEVCIKRAVIAGRGPFRVGLQMENGWIYAEGLTDWELDAQGRLLLAGHDEVGRLAVALELSRTPFPL